MIRHPPIPPLFPTPPLSHPHPVRSHGEAAAAPAVAANHKNLTGQQDVRGPDDAVERALTGAIAVVEEVLGHGLVDRHDRVDRKSTRLNSSHSQISYAVFCLK